jgi:hypothetical protein
LVHRAEKTDRRGVLGRSASCRGRHGEGLGAGLTIIRFTIEPPILGYRASWTRHDRKYRAYKERVLILAMAAGQPNEARANGLVKLSVVAYWKGKPKLDWKNVYGAIEDALWYEDDRLMRPGAYSDSVPFCGEEKVNVIIERVIGT